MLRTLIKNIQFDERGAIVFLGIGKTYQRRIRMVAYAPLLRQWMESHPLKSNPNYSLFVSEATNYKNQPLGMSGFEKIVAEEIRRAQILDKNANPYVLRHSRATHLASHMTEAQLCAYFGWVQGSKVVKRYIHLSGRDLDSYILKLSGLSDAEVENKIELKLPKPSKCVRCKELLSHGAAFCPRCGLSTDLASAYFERQKDSMIMTDKLEKLGLLMNELIQSLAPERAHELQEILAI